MKQKVEVSNQLPEQLHPFLRARDALVELCAHTLVVAGLLIGFWLVEQLMHVLWKDSERMLFGRIPLHWIFDASDIAILCGFLGYGVVSVIRAYNGGSKEVEK